METVKVETPKAEEKAFEFRGRKFKVPGSPSLRLIQFARENAGKKNLQVEVIDILPALVGNENYEALLDMGATLDDFGPIVEAVGSLYGLGLGNVRASSASSDSSQSSGKPTRQTSKRSTGSTSSKKRKK